MGEWSIQHYRNRLQILRGGKYVSTRRDKITARLAELGNGSLTALLLGLALLLILVALYEKNLILKAATAAWVLFP